MVLNTKGPLHSHWLNGNLIIYPQNFGPGIEYCVDGNTGNDNNSGSDWDNAKLTIAGAITASNLTCGDHNMNTIYVNAQTYTESLTTAPKNVNIIGVGAKTRLQGAQTFAATSQNYHFWNIQFRNTTGTYVTIPSTSYGVGFHGCFFDGNGTATIGISVGATQDFMLENCRFLGNPNFTTAINSTARQIRFCVRNNIISATTNGILIDAADDGYGNVICDNYIGRVYGDPNSSDQLAYGIRLAKTTGTSKYLLVNNRIEAIDGISSATADTHIENQSIGNIVNQAGTSTFDDAIA